MVGIVSTQIYATALSVTAEPLLNPGAGGLITYKADYSGATAEITRHEKATATIDGSDQVTGVTVEGTRGSGAANVTVELKDQTGTVLDDGTASVTGSPTYSTVVTMNVGSTKYNTVATVLATYVNACPCTTNIYVTEGHNSKDNVTLSSEGTLAYVQSSNNIWYELDTSGGTPAYFASFQFGSVPAGATIVSVKVHVEHYEDQGFKTNELGLEVGTGTLSSPTLLGTTTPPTLNGESNEAEMVWDVTTCQWLLHINMR